MVDRQSSNKVNGRSSESSFLQGCVLKRGKAAPKNLSFRVTSARKSRSDFLFFHGGNINHPQRASSGPNYVHALAVAEISRETGASRPEEKLAGL